MNNELLKTENESKQLQVVQSNHLVEATYKMDVRAKRVMLCLLGKLDARLPMPKVLHLDVNEYVEWTKTDKKTAYRDMKTGAELLLKTIIRTYDQKTRSGEMTVLAEKLRYFDQEARIECTFTQWVKPYIRFLAANFTQFGLQDCAQFRSFYTIRLYEMMMQYKSTGWRKIEVEQYRKIMGLEKKQYKVFADLKKRCIDPAMNEINEKSDYKITCDYLKKGRKINTLYFKFDFDEQLKLEL